MATDQLSRLGYRRDQILILPFPPPPSLANAILNGVLKKPEAVQFDQLQRQFFEAVQNIIKLSMQWPKQQEFDDVVRNLNTAISNVSDLSGLLTALTAAVNALSTTVSSHTVSIASILVSIANLTAAINAIASSSNVIQRGNGHPTTLGRIGAYDWQVYVDNDTTQEYRWDMFPDPPGVASWVG